MMRKVPPFGVGSANLAASYHSLLADGPSQWEHHDAGKAYPNTGLVVAAWEIHELKIPG